MLEQIPPYYNSGPHPSTTRPSVTKVSRDWGSIQEKSNSLLTCLGHLRGKASPIDPNSPLILKNSGAKGGKGRVKFTYPSMMAFFFLSDLTIFFFQKLVIS
jgi:hypothetical protein